ncbi:MAG: swarming motility regulation protein RssB [Paucimonas sp.]|jgi:two-component system response regulator QseB/two-component system response regulator BasR|nr:swarming motility regulation protein RssB [Paucimonas sp.]
MKICLVEDDLELGRALAAALRQDGHEAVWVRRAGDAKHWIGGDTFDAALLDLGLPDGNGLELIHHFRTEGKTLPILVITAREGMEDRLKGLNLGADDYLVKPFAIEELLARLRAVVRRAAGWSDQKEAIWTVKDLVLDEKRMTVTRDGQPVILSKTEFALLHVLMKHADRVLTRQEIETQAMLHNEGHVLDVHISKLRKKIGDGYIRTVRGIGYMLEK